MGFHEIVRLHEYGWPITAYCGNEDTGALGVFDYDDGSFKLFRKEILPPPNCKFELRNFIWLPVLLDFGVGVLIVLLGAIAVQFSLKAVLRTNKNGDS